MKDCLMTVTIHWVPELGLWKLNNGTTEIIVTPSDLDQPNWSQVAELLAKARQTVESGKAVCGLICEV